jgi:hypothetical protein
MGASSRRVGPRWPSVTRARMKGRRSRVRSRRSRWATGGLTRARHHPCGKRAARQPAALTSVVRPGPALTWCACTTRTAKLPSRRLTTGFQSSPVRSLATGVHPQARSHAESASSPLGRVPQGRVSCPAGVKTQATMVFLGTSRPAHRASMTGIVTAAPRDNSWRGYRQRQILTCGVTGTRWRGRPGLRVRRLVRRGAPTKFYHIAMRSNDHRS